MCVLAGWAFYIQTEPKKSHDYFIINAVEYWQLYSAFRVKEIRSDKLKLVLVTGE